MGFDAGGWQACVVECLGIPTETPIRIDSMDLTLNAQAANGPFEGNPTSCNPATTTVDAVSYESPGTTTSSNGAIPKV